MICEMEELRKHHKQTLNHCEYVTLASGSVFTFHVVAK